GEETQHPCKTRSPFCRRGGAAGHGDGGASQPAVQTAEAPGVRPADPRHPDAPPGSRHPGVLPPPGHAALARDRADAPAAPLYAARGGGQGGGPAAVPRPEADPGGGSADLPGTDGSPPQTERTGEPDPPLKSLLR